MGNRSLKDSIKISHIGAVMMTVALITGVSYVALWRMSKIDDHKEGTATIPAGEYLAFEYEVYGRRTEISYSFIVESGPAIDVYLLTPADYQRYIDGLYPIDHGSLTYENVQSIDESPYPEAGSYWAVIDNTDYGIAKPDALAVVVHYDLIAGGVPWGDQSQNMEILAILGFFFIFGLAILLVSVISARSSAVNETPSSDKGKSV